MRRQEREAGVDRTSPGPESQSSQSAPKPVQCPYCDSFDVEPMSLFGQQLLTMQFYCRTCRTPFEKMRDAAAIELFHQPGHI